MIKLSKLSLLLILCFGLTGSIYAVKAAGKRDLAKVSIEFRNLEDENSKNTYCARRDPNSKQKTCYLKNPDDGRTVAILDQTHDGDIVLNPRYVISHYRFEYGPIPPLEEMTVNIVDSLWGNRFTKSIASDRKIYGFSSNSSSRKTKTADFWIEVIFDGNYIRKYRILGNNNLDKSWKLVNKR